MATLQQIGVALKAAAAAGDTAAATKLAAAYKAMAAQGAAVAQAPPPQSPAAPTPQTPAPSPNFLDSTLATVNGLTSSVPFLNQASDAILAGGKTAIDAVTGQPADFGKAYQAIQDQRNAVAAKAPVADVAGGVAGTIAGAGALGATKLGAEALGMTGKMLPQLVNSSASTAAYEGLQGLSHGHTGGQLLGDEGLGAAGGAAGAVVGKAVEKTGQGFADAITGGAQRKATDAAIATAPDAAALKAGAKQEFNSAFSADTPAIAAPAFDRLMGNIQNSVVRFRPNSANDPQAVGLLQHLTDLQKAANTPGTVVDLQDLHLTRQLAQQVGQGKGREATMGNIIVGQIDGFIKSLKSSDILGGKNPTDAANSLLKGISDWSRATKVSSIEDAVKAADTYKSGPENGLKLSFLKLMRSPDYDRFSAAEKDAIRTVAKGTTLQNIAGLLGKLGFSFGGSSAHNVIGGTVGTSGLSALLAPFLGPAAVPVAFGVTTGVGTAARAAAERIGAKNAARAAQVVATPNIPSVAQAPNLLAPVAKPINLLLRGAVASGVN